MKTTLLVMGIYLAIWCGALLIPASILGLFNLPLYFEVSCIYLPVVFILYLIALCSKNQ